MWGAGGVCGRSFRWKFGGRGKFEGGVVWLRGVIDEKREKFVGEVCGRGWWESCVVEGMWLVGIF